MENLANTVSSPVQPVSRSTQIKDFLNSNNFIAKISFLFLVIFVVIVLFQLIMRYLLYLYSPPQTVKLLDGMVSATSMNVITQDISQSPTKLVTHSSNKEGGIEFTWSVWLYIDDLTYNSGSYRCVFYKGNDYAKNPNAQSQDSQGLNFPNNAPGLYIAPNTNQLVIMMNTFNVINEEITVDDIPINKWVNVIIRCQNNTLDVYINGTIIKSHNLHGVPKQNYGDVYVAPNGGFSGYISNLWYYNYALGTAEIARLSAKGPNTYMSGSNGLNIKNNNYLSLRWFFYGASDGYNP
jgi:hypothetical protein